MSSTPVTARHQAIDMTTTIPHSPEPTTSSQNDRQGTTRELQATLTMCTHCFDTLVHNLYLTYNPQMLHNLGIPLVHNYDTTTTTSAFLQDLPKVNVKCPLFVTWEKQQGPSNTKNMFWGGGRRNQSTKQQQQSSIQQQQPQQQPHHRQKPSYEFPRRTDETTTAAM
mmetsp:Transcript_21276/g.58933  ORF Transcript_21276/g.58933 Transcript_21276/m.58933 type:complete len:167 (-) Transcript_21276:744-1244(-)